MLRRRAMLPSHPAGRINATPMIDVVMCLIVFYLIVGKLVAEQRSDVFLPPSHTGQRQKTQEVLVINVLPPRAPGEPAVIEVEGVSIPPGLLTELIRERLAEEPGSAVHVRADRTLAWGAVLPVVRSCREAGVQAVRLAAEERQ